MKYTITKNAEFGSLEVRFNEKPADTVRLALKRLKMRWHGVNKCWYGYASESALVSAILENAPEEQPATVYTDGYLGGGAVYGSKSNKSLYGADLSAAIRADIKAAGIKDVTVKCKSYSGGQSITATIRTSPADYVDEADYVAAYRVRGNWVYDGERSIYIGDFIRRLPIQSAQGSRAILSGKSPPLTRLLGVANSALYSLQKKNKHFVLVLSKWYTLRGSNPGHPD